MSVRLAKVGRRPNWPAWAIVLCAAWLALVAAGHFLAARLARPIEFCAFKRLTGLPCAACGSTRAGFHLLHGHLASALLHNPLVTSILVVAFAAMILRLGFGRTVSFKLTKGERIFAWCGVSAAVLLNWTYLIAFVG